MNTSKILVLVTAALTIFSCKTTENSHQKNHKTHWGYTGKNKPANWSHISEQYKDCDGNSQSPININDTQTTSQKNQLTVHYTHSKIAIVNNGHTEQFNVDKGNSLTFNGKVYSLKQFHMHTLSEHTVNGRHFPLELHFVNKAKDNTYAVISVLVEEGEASDFLTKYIPNLPKTEGEYNADESYDLRKLMPYTKHYYHYKGSFTTPPCTEVVEWIVLKEHLTASKKQLNALHQLMHDNYRPLQKLNHNVIGVQ